MALGATGRDVAALVLAGLAVAATDTPGQAGVLEAAPGAGFLFPSGDAAALAAGLQALAGERGRLAIAKHAARWAAEQRFSWARERPRLLQALTDWPAAARIAEPTPAPARAR